MSAGATVSRSAGDPACEAGHEPIAQRRNADRLGRPLGIGGDQRNSHRDDPGDVVGATAPLAFLAAADDQRIDDSALADRQDADALGAAELVRAEREQVDVWPHLPQVEPVRRLHGVGVEQRARGSGSAISATGAKSVIVPTSLFTAITLTIADVVGDRVSERCEIDAAGGVHRYDTSAEPLDRVQHGVVLRGRAHRESAVAGHGAGDRSVVGLRAAPREHHLARPAPDHAGHGVACLIHGATGVAGEAVGPLGLAKRSVRNGSIASTASSRIGVVAA